MCGAGEMGGVGGRWCGETAAWCVVDGAGTLWLSRRMWYMKTATGREDDGA